MPSSPASSWEAAGLGQRGAVLAYYHWRRESDAAGHIWTPSLDALAARRLWPSPDAIDAFATAAGEPMGVETPERRLRALADWVAQRRWVRPLLRLLEFEAEAVWCLVAAKARVASRTLFTRLACCPPAMVALASNASLSPQSAAWLLQWARTGIADGGTLTDGLRWDPWFPPERCAEHARHVAKLLVARRTLLSRAQRAQLERLVPAPPVDYLAVR